MYLFFGGGGVGLMPLFRCIYFLHIFFFNLALPLFLKVYFIYLFVFIYFVWVSILSLFFLFFWGGGGGLGVTPLSRSIYFFVEGFFFLTDLIWGIAARHIRNI